MLIRLLPDSLPALVFGRTRLVVCKALHGNLVVKYVLKHSQCCDSCVVPRSCHSLSSTRANQVNLACEINPLSET